MRTSGGLCIFQPESKGKYNEDAQQAELYEQSTDARIHRKTVL